MNYALPRSAGVLLHITSLPSSFGVGDLGPEAFAFVDFLSRTQQKYWQILPLNPTGESEGFSPYSSSSAMAGNVLLISPQALAADGLLTPEDLKNAELPATAHADLRRASEIKKGLLWKAYRRYLADDSPEQQAAYNAFYEQHAYWLADYARFELLRDLQNGKPWWEWPESLRDRKQQALDDLESRYSRELHEIRWQQMVFHRQWEKLRHYCAGRNIRIIGDLPFYVAQNSADVWSNRLMFAVDAAGKMKAVAGVPPDAFNDNGQLWGLPVYNWKELAKTKFRWWMTRLRKNLELFDLVRIDHFRAFASYWCVPPSHTNAKNGKWKKGPGKAFFREVKKEFGQLPFIAEDLGEIGPEVYELRDAFQLPGMNVLQFAFGNDMPSNAYIPHHNTTDSVIYTGTHDNNTARGWFTGLSSVETDNLYRYLGRRVKEQDLADVLARIAYSSVSALAILPMQDILGLDASARMNTPAGSGPNWSWRLEKKLITPAIEDKLVEWCTVYDRRRDGDTSFATVSAALSRSQNAWSHA